MLKKLDFGKLVVYSALVLFSLLYLMPIYMTVITALKHPANISLTTAWQLPGNINWGSFAEAYNTLGPNFMNSLYLAVSATIISAVIGSLNGYVFSKWKLPGNELIFTLVLFGMFIPYQIILIPLFRVLRQLGLYGGIPGLALAHIVYGIPITSLIFLRNSDNFPDISKLLRPDTGIDDRVGPDGRSGVLRNLSANNTPAFGSGVCRRCNMAVYPDLERIPVGNYPDETLGQPDNRRTRPAGRGTGS